MTLEANDILFIDSSHVLKVGSDVHHLFAEVLPALKPGVYTHFHDIFFPFEYPYAWIQEGRYWTEAYALRAFLQFNTTFEIVVLQHVSRTFSPHRVRAAYAALPEERRRQYLAQTHAMKGTDDFRPSAERRATYPPNAQIVHRAWR